jgi:hypothetical protein
MVKLFLSTWYWRIAVEVEIFASWDIFSVDYNRSILFKIQDYWLFGLCPSSGILKTREHNVSETGSVSVLR